MVSATEVLELLDAAEVTARGFLANASNHTLLVQVGPVGDGVFAVYKPRAGERPLWDFPRGTLCQREAAAYVVDAFLGWDLVPPTVMRDEGPMGAGSLQLFVPHDPERHYFVLVDEGVHNAGLARMALFDLLINNADRKASHVLLSDDGTLRGCDHGLAFNVEPKLRTVIWELGGTPVEQSLRADLARLATELDDATSGTRRRLDVLLGEREVGSLAQRAGFLRNLAALPAVDPDRRPYPWPPL